MKEHDTNIHEKDYALEAQQFAEQNKVLANDNIRICVDGRYYSDEKTRGALSRPGADFGLVMGLLGLKNKRKIELSAKQCFDTVYDFVTSEGNDFNIHTDKEAEHAQRTTNETHTGCGHERNALNPKFASSLYGINLQDVDFALACARTKSLLGKVRETVLDNYRSEKGVIIVKGLTNTINHRDNSNMYFVYDKDRDELFQRKFTQKVKIPGLTFEDLNEILEKQTNASLSILAAHKPLIEVNFNDNIAQAQLITMIPQLT